MFNRKYDVAMDIIESEYQQAKDMHKNFIQLSKDTDDTCLKYFYERMAQKNLAKMLIIDDVITRIIRETES